MGDGGAAPMQVKIGEDDACDPTGEFVSRGERKGNQCWEWICKRCGGVLNGKKHKLAVHIAVIDIAIGVSTDENEPSADTNK